MNRPEFTKNDVFGISGGVQDMLLSQFAHKGWHSLVSTHEILGIVDEEHFELTEAVRDGDATEIKKELWDIAIAALYGILSMQHCDW